MNGAPFENNTVYSPNSNPINGRSNIQSPQGNRLYPDTRSSNTCATGTCSANTGPTNTCPANTSPANTCPANITTASNNNSPYIGSYIGPYAGSYSGSPTAPLQSNNPLPYSGPSMGAMPINNTLPYSPNNNPMQSSFDNNIYPGEYASASLDNSVNSYGNNNKAYPTEYKSPVPPSHRYSTMAPYFLPPAVLNDMKQYSQSPTCPANYQGQAPTCPANYQGQAPTCPANYQGQTQNQIQNPNQIPFSHQAQSIDQPLGPQPGQPSLDGTNMMYTGSLHPVNRELLVNHVKQKLYEYDDWAKNWTQEKESNLENPYKVPIRMILSETGSSIVIPADIQDYAIKQHLSEKQCIPSMATPVNGPDQNIPLYQKQNSPLYQNNELIKPTNNVQLVQETDEDLSNSFTSWFEAKDLLWIIAIVIILVIVRKVLWA